MLGENLKKAREKNKLTQDEVARKLFISRQALSKWENNITEPDLETLKKLEAIYGVSISKIINDKHQSKLDVTNKVFLFAGIFIFVFNVLLIFIYLRLLENSIPAHYNSSFEIDRYGSKYETLLYLMVYGIFFGMNLIGYFLAKNEYENPLIISGLVVNILGTIINLGFGIFVICINSNYLKDNTFSQLFMSLIASLMIDLGILCHPKINKKPNSIFGIKTSYGLSSEKAWYKINLFGSYIIIVSSAIMLIISLFLENPLLVILIPWMPLILGIIIIFILNSYFQKKEN